MGPAAMDVAEQPVVNTHWALDARTWEDKLLAHFMLSLFTVLAKLTLHRIDQGYTAASGGGR